jgi:AcrR family transcriptional regulator
MGRPREVSDQQIVTAARRCFLERGIGVSAAEIAKELGVSHTTLFNRFGSKKGLMQAALGPPTEVGWVDALDAGPDERPIREQLIAHVRVMSVYFHDLQQGFGLLMAAGLDPRQTERTPKQKSSAERAYTALTGWLTRAQTQGRIGPCDIETLASTILGALHSWAFTARVCGNATSAVGNTRYVERLIDLLWNGIGVE